QPPATRTRSRAAEKLLRLEQNLHGGRDVTRGTRMNHGKKPALVLHRSGEADIRQYPVIGAHANVGQRASSGNELLTHLLVPEIELHTIACVEPVIRPCLSTLALATNPTPQQIAVVHVSVEVSKVGVVETRNLLIIRHVNVRVNALEAKVKSWKFWQPRSVYPGTPYRPLRIPGWQKDDLIVRETVPIKRQPISKLW